MERGKVGRVLSQLVLDLRHIMEPYTASKLKVLPFIKSTQYQEPFIFNRTLLTLDIRTCDRFGKGMC